jgi:protein-L-isoaspartate O-methyltransferase
MPLNGYIDRCQENCVAGWAWDSDLPGRRLDVEILIDGNAVARITAEEYREDLKHSGIGDGHFGFSYTFPFPVDPESQLISAVVVDTNFFLRRPRSEATAPEDMTFLAGRGSARLNWPPMRIDRGADAAALRAMHDHVNSSWSYLGRTEPYWSVLTDPMFKSITASSHREIFFESGKRAIEDFCAFMLRSGVYLSAEQTCFELGCGVGRLTTSLSPLFSRVTAADVSVNHLRVAEAILAQRGIRNVSLRHLMNLNDLAKIGPFDVFFSLIVFQHNPPPIIAYMLRTILMQLEPNGIGYFQIPTYKLDYTFSVDDYLSRIRGQERTEMEHHVLPQQVVIEIIYDCGCKILEIREDGWTGDVNGVSNTFLIRKLR